jgi:hypothetical protein
MLVETLLVIAFLYHLCAKCVYAPAKTHKELAPFSMMIALS